MKWRNRAQFQITRNREKQRREGERKTETRTEGDAKVSEGAAGEGDVDGELGVAERRQKRADSGDGVGDNDGGAGMECRSVASGDEYAGADHSADSESDEVVPPERALHVGP